MEIMKLVITGGVALSLTGCADHADKIQASYVSPVAYQDYSCRQIRAEIGRVAHKVNVIAGVQDKTATSDSWATGVGLILFWPSLFFIAHGDQHQELAELKGQYDALEQEAIHKNCDVAKQLKVADEERAKMKAAEKEETQKTKSNFND